MTTNASDPQGRVEPLVGRLRELADAVTKGPDAIRREFTMRVPVDPDHDADIILSMAADEIARMQQMLERANDLLRSACAIASREGVETNWDAFHRNVQTELMRQSQVLYGSVRLPHCTATPKSFHVTPNTQLDRRTPMLERFAGHSRGVEVENDGYGRFSERSLKTAELCARDAAGQIQDDIFKHANTAGVCYYPIWKLISAACQQAIDADRAVRSNTNSAAESAE